MSTKYVFVTGGVVSGLGKGITAASLGRLLKNRGYKVANQKFDPYINVDPGTMSPYEHGEVFVTDDGAETDLDLGHYERFTDENLTKNSSITTGRIYQRVIEKERRGDYLGKTVQVIPHITNEIKEKVYSLGKDGAVFLCEDGTVYRGNVPEVNGSSIGAGDSMVAGFVSAMKKGADMHEAFLQSLIMGTATASVKGIANQFEIEKIKGKITVERIMC